MPTQMIFSRSAAISVFMTDIRLVGQFFDTAAGNVQGCRNPRQSRKAPVVSCDRNAAAASGQLVKDHLPH
jgi:hypothetical protein